ncbi:hypothetical protein [Caldibacillus debilis]|uniref:Uncharacterized protein n=1 Tax=Caldibacillus debilis TaxID=301148 RepID=A0A150MF96_9BACI|nr:hypothetical protein [Caldibacillus debilis]KYD23151.1 hypothetical protein B4135_0974 [Caldibacillus debilis]
MSNYEGMNGFGKLKKKDLMDLKKLLIETHNKEISKIERRLKKKYGIKQATSRTWTFPFLDIQTDYCGSLGWVTLCPEDGTFRFRVNENNHAVEDAWDSLTFRALINFLRSLPNKGKIYGAKVYHWSEYDEDQWGNKTPGRFYYYGAWKN